MDITALLQRALDPATIIEAQAQLKQAAAEHFDAYLAALTQVLAAPTQRTDVRMLALMCIKNELLAKDPATRQANAARWLALAQPARQQIKEASVLALMLEETPVANLAALLVAAIASVELPKTEWPELIPMIVTNTKLEQPVHVKRALLLAIGYICEQADPNDPGVAAQSNGILIAIVQGAQLLETSKEVRLTAINALVNLLKFIRANFDKEGERNYIMQVVCEATQAADVDIQEAAFGALARIMHLYYRYMGVYMEKALYGLTVSGMQLQNERVLCMAVEFWLTVCEVELDIAFQMEEYGEAEFELFNFAHLALQQVLPPLLQLLTRQNDDEDDTWSVAMAAGACLQLFAQDTGNYVVQPVLQFVELRLVLQSWHDREAAVMAFGLILDGPDLGELRVLTQQALLPILGLMGDSNLQVKETVAWCLGRIAELVVEAVDPQLQLPAFINALGQGLKDHPRVLTNCCWTLINLVEQLQEGTAPYPDTGVLSVYYEAVVQVLLEISGRNDNENAGRALAYEALGLLVMHAANDVMNVVNGVATECLARLEATLALMTQVLLGDDKRNLEEMQTNILGALTLVIRRVGPAVGPVADLLMTLFLKLLAATAEQQQQAATGETLLVEEDVFLAVLALASAVGVEFGKYLELFLPFLTQALRNTELSTCITAVNLVADLLNLMGGDIAPVAGGLMEIMGLALQSGTVQREVQPVILLCFGDVAQAIGPQFQAYLDVVMGICHQASNLAPADALDEAFDYVLLVHEAVLDAYVGVVAGMAPVPDAVFPYVQNIFAFLQQVALNINLAVLDEVCRLAVGMLGDLAAMFPDGRIREAYRAPWVAEFIRKTRTNANFSQATKDTARWARDQQRRQLA